jgi:putative nucleotidyltransferase with HDIG domain
VLKQIAISELVVDMYISEIIETPNVPMPKKKKGMIRDSRIISKFIEIGILQIVIDTEKGLDLIHLSQTNEPHKKETDRIFNQVIEDQLAGLKKQTSTEYQNLAMEWGNAKEIFKTSASIVHKTIVAIKNGERINPNYFDDASKAISRSIMRNKDALTWLGKIRTKNSYLYEHSVNTATLMGIFAHAYGLTTPQIECCITGALLHDLGEAHVNEEFFVRAGPLTPDELNEVKEHVPLGLKLFEGSDQFSDISKRIVGEHHERYDGSGYPLGLKGNEISLFGRMFAIVDTFDAVTNNRCYKNAIASSFGMRTLLELSKTHFEEGLVHQFIKCMGIYPTGSLARLDNQLLAVVIAQNPISPLKPLVRAVFNTKDNSFIEPVMIDLGKLESGTKILRYENPCDFGIEITDFMPDEMD